MIVKIAHMNSHKRYEGVSMGLLKEVKNDAETFEGEEETTLKVGDKKVTIKVEDDKTPPSKRQLLVE